MDQIAPTSFELDTSNHTITAAFSDPFTARRAEKIWRERLSNAFMLSDTAGTPDYHMVRGGARDGGWFLCCVFKTACGRYAFWRLMQSDCEVTPVIAMGCGVEIVELGLTGGDIQLTQQALEPVNVPGQKTAFTAWASDANRWKSSRLKELFSTFSPKGVA